MSESEHAMYNAKFTSEALPRNYYLRVVARVATGDRRCASSTLASNKSWDPSVSFDMKGKIVIKHTGGKLGLRLEFSYKLREGGLDGTPTTLVFETELPEETGKPLTYVGQVTDEKGSEIGKKYTVGAGRFKDTRCTDKCKEEKEFFKLELEY